jgi:exodeoxyribonuclease-3
MPTEAPLKTSIPAARGTDRRAAGPRRSGPPAAEARILTANIAAAAAERAARILVWLRSRNDDVIVLSETSGGPGTELLKNGLEAAGYRTLLSVEPGERGVMIASRLPFSDTLEQVSVTLPCRAQGIVLETEPRLALLGVYIPSRDRSPEKVARKERFIASLLGSIRDLPPELRSNLVLLGDYNVVARHHEPNLPGFFPYEYDFHDELAALGLSAAHELRPWGKRQPHSWIGRTGIGYLYDYAHLGSSVADRLQRSQYLQAPRQQRLSDHAALAVRIRLDPS